MKKISTLAIRIFFFAALLFSCVAAKAQHITGADLTYTHVSGRTYKISVTLFAKCGAATHTAFSTLPISTPQVCIYNGTTSVSSIFLKIDSSLSFGEVHPLCSEDTSACVSLTSSIPGVEKFVYSDTFTLPSTSAVWRFIYTGENGPGAASGRAASVTNITAGTLGTIQLIDTLNNTASDNSSPALLTDVPVFLPDGITYTYNPMASDPDGDALSFSLVPAQQATSTCGSIGGPVTYTGTAWTPPLTPISATTPFNVSAGSFSFDSANGKITFSPNTDQRSVFVYNIKEYRSGVLVGTSQWERSFYITSAISGSFVPCFRSMYAGPNLFTPGCSGMDTLTIADASVGCGIAFQWQSSPDDRAWSNIAGATSELYPVARTSSGYFRSETICAYTGGTAYSTPFFIPGSSVGGHFQTTVTKPSDTVCLGPQFYTYSCSAVSGSHVTTSYGDANSDDHILGAASPHSATFSHNYSAPGTYSIREVLYNGTARIDSSLFSYEYTQCENLPIKFYFDNNANCIKDSGEAFLDLPILTEVDSNGIAIDTISATSGFYYKAYGPAGTVYSFRFLSVNGGVELSCPSSRILYDTISLTAGSYPTKYFGFVCDSATYFDLAEYSTFIAGRHEARINATLSNSHCAPKSGIFSVTFSPKYIYEAATPAPLLVSGNKITWSFDTLSTLYHPVLIDLLLNKAGTADLPIGDTVNSFNTISPIAGDMDTTNNSSNRVDTVIAAFDPNEMSVTPSGYISAGTQLLYTINFENTGNAPAQNIYVMDTLSDDVDPSSLRMKTSSAVMNIATFNDGTHNIVKFDFPGINLPDSSHHGQCDGMVVFTINTKNGLSDGTLIDNRAGIYFDDNAVVMTNTVEDIIGSASTETGTQVVTANNKVAIYPNPTNETLTIKTPQGIYTNYTISNTVGQVLLQNDLTNTRTTADVKTLASGLYYITLRGSGGAVVKKFVKM